MTTTTFFPDGDPESTSVDGFVQNDLTSDTWANLRNAASGTTAGDAGIADTRAMIFASTTTDEWRRFRRAFLLFDTDSLPDGDTIDSATLEVVPSTSDDAFTSSISVVVTTPASNTAIVTGDFDQTGTTKQAADRTIAGLTVDGSTFNAWTLNATGLSSIDSAGITKFGMRITQDLSDSEPTWSSAGLSQISAFSAEEAEIGDVRPKLVVMHSAPANPLFMMSRAM